MLAVTEQDGVVQVLSCQSFSSSTSLKCSSLKLLQYSKQLSLPSPLCRSTRVLGLPSVPGLVNTASREGEYCFGDPWCLFFFLFSNVLWPAQIPPTFNNYFCFAEACQISSSRKSSLICSISWYFSFTLSICQYCLLFENIILLPWRFMIYVCISTWKDSVLFHWPFFSYHFLWGRVSVCSTEGLELAILLPGPLKCGIIIALGCNLSS